MSCDHYATIGVECSATQKEIAKAFRARARVLHPDKQPPGASETAKQKAKRAFQELARAYEVLDDPQKRAQYDLGRRQQPAPSSTSGSSGQGSAGKAQRRPTTEAAGGAQSGRGGPSSRAAPPRTAGWQWAREAAAAAAAEQELRQNAERQRLQEQHDRERRRQCAEEKERTTGLGAQWVKPPPPRMGPQEEWKGWDPNGTNRDSSESDSSSLLSFNIDIDLNDLNLDDVELLEEDPAEAKNAESGGGEHWTFMKAPTPREPEKQERDSTPSAMPPASPTYRAPQCCVTQ